QLVGKLVAGGKRDGGHAPGIVDALAHRRGRLQDPLDLLADDIAGSVVDGAVDALTRRLLVLQRLAGLIDRVEIVKGDERALIGVYRVGHFLGSSALWAVLAGPR